MNFTNDGFVIMSKAEFDVMAAAVAETEVAGKGKAAKEKEELSELEKKELKARIMAEPNVSIRQRLIKDNMYLFR